MFLDLSQKKFVYLKHYKYFVFFAQLPWRTQLPSHREFLHLFVLFASKINVESMKKTSLHLQHVITSKENKLPVLTYLHVYVEMVFCYQNCSDLLREKLF